MQDERNLPQDEDAEEVEGHHLQRRGDEPDPSAEDDDEVEAHHLQRGPSTGPEHLQR